MSLRFRVGHTSISLRSHFDPTSIPRRYSTSIPHRVPKEFIRSYFDLTSILLGSLFDVDLTLISVSCRFYFTLISLWYRLDFTLISLLFLTLISLRSTFEISSSALATRLQGRGSWATPGTRPLAPPTWLAASGSMVCTLYNTPPEDWLQFLHHETKKILFK